VEPKRGLAVLLVGSEVAAAGYLGILVWLCAVWMLDDTTASRMSPGDWYIEAVRRLAMTSVGSVLFGALCYVANRRRATALIPSQPKVAQRIGATLGGASLALIGLVGAVQFVTERSFM
jgi:hypothetical protein